MSQNIEGTMNPVGELVRKSETDFISGTTTHSKYVVSSMYEDLNKIDAYINSKQITGDKDSKGRDKPFFNIVTAACNIWYRATDIDRKNIKIKATSSAEVVPAFLATVLIQDWMKRFNFGSFLNEWGRTLARYGSAVIKMVEQEGELKSIVVLWNRLIVDSVDFDSNPKIEILELTESQLRKRKGYDKDIVDKLCITAVARETIGKDKKDTKDNFIKLYEVHGEMPLSYLTGDDKDKDEFVQQMHVVSFVANKNTGKWDDFTLISGKEEKDPYMLTHLIKEDGQTLAIGAVQHLFEAQWMMNHTIKSIKDQLDLASKLIFQTSDGNFVGQNALTAIENGDILIHALNQPLTELNNTSHDITALLNFGQQWKNLANEITGVSESMMGVNPPSGQAWRLTEALLNESHSLFELMTENKGLYIEDMFREHVIPHEKKKLNHSKEISAILDANDISKIDSRFIKNVSTREVNKMLVKRVLNGEMPTPEDQAMMTSQIKGQMQENLSEMGNQRFFKPDEISDVTWKEVLKDVQWRLEVDVTGESSTAKDDLVTLSTVLQTIANPAMAGVLNTPQGKTLFNKILQKAGGVSPLELSNMPSPIQPQQVASPAGGGQVGAMGGLVSK